MPPRARLTSATLARVREALVDYQGAPEGAEPSLRGALAALSEEARGNGIPPEDVLIALKQVWNDLPDMHRAPAERTRALQRVVTMCIKEYYR